MLAVLEPWSFEDSCLFPLSHLRWVSWKPAFHPSLPPLCLNVHRNKAEVGKAFSCISVCSRNGTTRCQHEVTMSSPAPQRGATHLWEGSQDPPCYCPLLKSHCPLPQALCPTVGLFPNGMNWKLFNGARENQWWGTKKVKAYYYKTFRRNKQT